MGGCQRLHCLNPTTVSVVLLLGLWLLLGCDNYKKCYTCDLEFDGYINLMNHRKEIHPSTKKCRNFPGGNCIHGLGCWYAHEEQLMEVEESEINDIVINDNTGSTRTKCPL